MMVVSAIGLPTGKTWITAPFEPELQLFQETFTVFRARFARIEAANA